MKTHGNRHIPVVGYTEDGEYFTAIVCSRPGEMWLESCLPTDVFHEVERMLQDGLLELEGE